MDSAELKKCDLPPLPQGKSIVAVFADFLSYLFQCVRQYIHETHANGKNIWITSQEEIEFVLTHPNGWEGLQQDKMRKAATMAGLVPNTPSGRSRIHFLSEGEADLNFCVRSGLTTDSISVCMTYLTIKFLIHG